MGYLYDSGDLFLTENWKKFLETPIIGTHNDSFYITYWSILHFISGIIFVLIFKYFNIQYNIYLTGLIIHSLWELWQVIIGMSHPWKLKGHNNLVDIIVDTLFFMIGVYISKIIFAK